MTQKKKFFEKVLNLMYPNNIKCMFCNEELNDNSYNNTCVTCLSTLPFISNVCYKCGCQMLENQTGTCLKCKRNNFYFTNARSIFRYEGSPLQVVHNIKYNNQKYLVESVVKYLLHSFATWNVFPDIVTNVPMFPKKEKERGYNQSTLMAKMFCEKSNLNFVELCSKIKDTTSQTSLNIKERFQNIENSFALKPENKKLIKNKTILIIDDVITTGATTNELSKVLLMNGASCCYVLTFAHTSLEQVTLENL